jgi:hypothetical protein
MNKVVRQYVRPVGDDLVVTIPLDEADRLSIAEGDLVEVSIRRLGSVNDMRPEARDAFKASWNRNEAGYRYLADR